MKTFRYKYKALYIVLAYVGVALCAAVLGISIWQCVADGGFNDFYSAVKYIILFAVSVFAPVLLLSVIHNSKYIVTDTKMITSLGIIKSKFSIQDVSKIIYKEKTCQILVYFSDGYMVFRLNEDWQEEFIKLILSKNNKILYDETDDFEKETTPKDDETPKK